MPTTAPLRLTIAAEVGRQHVPFVRRQLRAAHRILRPALRELSVAMVRDRRMEDLHLEFLGLPGPTDVLTFPLDHDAYGNVVAGEVVVCVPEARRRAKDHNVSVEQELLLYTLHGMLHLCGYDDRTDASFRTMHATEDRILTQLGVGPVFDPDRTAHAASGARSRRRGRGRKRNRANGAS